MPKSHGAIERRSFLKAMAAPLVLPFLRRLSEAADSSPDLPNILWITCEDTSLTLGCYGDEYARTPNLDRLASEGVLYENMYATAPVCSPARSCIITGVYAPSLGTQHLRSNVRRPKGVRCFTEYLREAGYYCTNNVKQDYQFKAPKGAWDESSMKAHWRNRPEGMPFFSIFNLGLTHQSRTRYTGEELAEKNASLPESLRHDPGEAPLPPYYPDTPLVRENVAACYTQVTLMDQKVGEILNELEQDGLAEETIVFFYSDHGAGLPRGKRWLHDTGTHVPFIVRCPEKFRGLIPAESGSKSEAPVSFVDLAPTMLSLTGLPIPDYMQGQAFLGDRAGEPREFIFAARDRVDEVIECSRTVHDGHFQYIRNFHPHRPEMAVSWYSEPTPIRAEIRRLHAEGSLEGAEAHLVQSTRPAEELYDLSADPYEMTNLVDSEEHHEVLEEMRTRLYEIMCEIRDTGLLTESEIKRRTEGSPYEMLHAISDAEYKEILDTAWLVGMGPSHSATLTERLSHWDSAVRYWAAVGLAVLGTEAKEAEESLRRALTGPSPSVHIAAAEALCYLGHEAEALPVLAKTLEEGNDPTANEAATALLAISEKARPVLDDIRKAQDKDRKQTGHTIDHIIESFESE